MVKVEVGEHHLTLKLYTMHRVFGPQAMTDLFLAGVFRTSVGQGTVQTLLSESGQPEIG